MAKSLAWAYLSGGAHGAASADRGGFVRTEEARISPLDRGFLFGDAVYRWSFLLNCAILLASVGLVLLHRRVRYEPWQGRLSSVFDVSLVTVILAAVVAARVRSGDLLLTLGAGDVNSVGDWLAQK